MISTQAFDHVSFPVPNEWIFENFLPINEKLEGQTVKIKSVFNAKDSDPSFMVYVDDSNKYKFIDFSTGAKGDGTDLVMQIYGITQQEAWQKIYKMYKDEHPNGITFNKSEFVKTIWTVVDYKVRNWNQLDAKYWLEHHLPSDHLDGLNIRPLSHYTFEKKRGSQKEYFVFDKPLCYGFFTKKGELYKIYNPGEKKTKYIKVMDYIQGSDQLQFKAPWLLILSGLKDIAAFTRIRFKGIECIAGDSESNLISPKDIEFFKSKYKYISTLFDNDDAGKKSTLSYMNTYQIPGVSFEVEKDVAECLKQHDIPNTTAFLKEVLALHFNTYFK